jgi:hypothetical protein
MDGCVQAKVAQFSRHNGKFWRGVVIEGTCFSTCNSILT